MKNQRMGLAAILWGIGLLAATTARAQQAAPDLIVFNGKIVTVDDKSFGPRVGTIAQALAIKDGKIVAIGANAQVRGQAGPNTKIVDLKGRTVLPGLIGVHDHPYDWAPVNPHIIKKVLTDDLVVARVLSGSPEEQAKAFPNLLQEAVGKARPGEWIFVIFPLGDHYEYSAGGNGGFGRPNSRVMDGKMIPFETLNRLAPNNPVLLRDVFTGTQINARALEETKKVFPYDDMIKLINKETGTAEGGGGMSPMRWLFQEVAMKDHYPQLREIVRSELSWWAGYGMTSYGSRAYTPSNLAIFSELSQTGEMPMRNMWTWGWREEFFNADPYLFRTLAVLNGLGNDYFWNGGAWSTNLPSGGCSTLTPRDGSNAPACSYDPGSDNYRRLYDYVKSGGRIAALHSSGDRDIDNLLDVIVKASRDAGFTPEQIRAKRHSFDHLVISPRPDQLKLIKDLGMVLGGDAFEVYQASPAVLTKYGERATEWVVPKKSLVDAQIPSGFEVDRALGSTDLTVFWTLARSIDRKSWDGKNYAVTQKIPREVALKTATLWGSQYLQRENKLGSLEVGKFADFIVLDRDYLTVPEDQIENIRVLMTVLGGKTVHLTPSLAREVGMSPVGAQVELGGAAAQW